MNKMLPIFLTVVLGRARYSTATHQRPAPVVRGLLLLALLLTVRLSAVAQAPAWQSAQAVAAATAVVTSNFSGVTSTAVDAAGNVYLTGNFTNMVVLGGTTLTSLGSEDVFVAKFNPSSNQFVWALRAGGSGYDVPYALAVSGSNVYVAGFFSSSTAGFGSTMLANAGGSSGSLDAFVVKLTDTGSFVWAQRAGGTSDDRVTALAVSGANVYVTGNFSSSTAGFGPLSLVPTGTYDVFVAKLTDTGNFVWAQRAGGANYDTANALAVNGANVYVAGNFTSPTADFGAATLTNRGANLGADVFVAKLTDTGSAGSFTWAQRAGGVDGDAATALAISGASVYVAGTFGRSASDFGPTTLTSIGASDVFVARLTDAGSTGSFTWAQRAGGAGDDGATALAVSGASIYVAGNFFSPTAWFGTATLALTNGSMPFSCDIFVAKLTDVGSAGNFVWAQQAGGIGYDEASALTVSSTSVYVAGYIKSPSGGFGTIPFANPNPNSDLGFLASLTDPTLTATTTSHALAPAQLYPNPARHTATLRLPAGTTPAPLTLTDALGRAVRHFPAPAGLETVLDLRGLPAGLYLLRGAGPAQRLVVE